MRERRGSLHFAQWRFSAGEILASGSSSPIPAGLFAQALRRAFVISNDSVPRFISTILFASQCIADPEGLRDDENLGFAPKLVPGDSQEFGQLSEAHAQIGF